MPVADNAPRVQQDHRVGIVPIAAPQACSSDKTSVTLWDELVPPARLPIPIPVPLPGNAQHAMERNACISNPHMIPSCRLIDKDYRMN